MLLVRGHVTQADLPATGTLPLQLLLPAALLAALLHGSDQDLRNRPADALTIAAATAAAATTTATTTAAARTAAAGGLGAKVKRDG